MNDSILLSCEKYSEYAQRYLAQHPYLREWLVEHLAVEVDHDQLKKWWLDIRQLFPNDTQGLSSSIRRWRHQIQLLLMEQDLTHHFSQATIMKGFSLLADMAINVSLSELTHELSQKFGVPHGEYNQQPQNLMVIGMGKLGGYELNASSDIDLIFLFDENGETRAHSDYPLARGSISNQEFFNKLGRQLINILSEVTDEGMAFRVDMRLRPNGEAGPLVCSLAMLETYFFTQGREWERYAWIKSRVITPFDSHNQAAIDHLNMIVKPFVYRRYLDFGVIDAIRELHIQIREQNNQKMRKIETRLEESIDVKLGRGGIREIEFIAQMFQLIRGGQYVALRTQQTIAALQVISHYRWLPQDVVDQLIQAYRFLRDVEHRLQYRRDEQTHVLPGVLEEQTKIAAMMQLTHSELLQQLQQHRACVMKQFDALFDTPPSNTTSVDLAQINQIDSVAYAAIHCKIIEGGFENPENVLQTLQHWVQKPIYLSLQEKQQSQINQLIQQSLEQIPTINSTLQSQQSNDELLIRVIDLLEKIMRRKSYLALLSEFPHVLQRLITAMAQSKWGASFLIKHPQLLDELIDPASTDEPWQVATVRNELQQRLEALSGQTEQQLDACRHIQQMEIYRILLRDLNGQIIRERADHLSDLADTIIQQILPLLWQEFLDKNPQLPKNPLFGVIAYGKLGGKELGYGSDLDLVYIFDDDDGVNEEVYVRLARRLTTWLTTRTAAGTLYEVDTRLRPNGQDGLLASRFGYFARYQEGGLIDTHQNDDINPTRTIANFAQTWEHQALTRARFVAGHPKLQQQFDALRQRILCHPRNPNDLRRDILAMRQKMHEGHPNHSALFDVKHDQGGLVDVEFCVQYLILRHAHQLPSLTENIGNAALLVKAAQLGLLPTALAKQASDAYLALRNAQHRAKLDDQEICRLPPEPWQEIRQVIGELWNKLFHDQINA